VPYEQVDPTDGFDELDGYTTGRGSDDGTAIGWAVDDDDEAPF
jgi:hypothetical protein